jgi:hypothetical protein
MKNRDPHEWISRLRETLSRCGRAFPSSGMDFQLCDVDVRALEMK